MSIIPFIDLETQYKKIQHDIHLSIKNVLGHGQYIMGPEIEALESKLCSHTGASYCLAVSNGTDALSLCLMALDIGPGDEVIIPDFSFYATLEVVLLRRATPVFVDVDEQTCNLDADLIEKAITSKTKAIIVVSLYGQLADFKKINETARKYNLPVIEDAAQSFGASNEDQKSCASSILAATSFFPSKPLGCYGDGGAVFTSDKTLAEKMKSIRVHGQKERYHHHFVGLNARMDTIQAAILLEKLKIFDQEIEQRQQIAKRYNDHLFEQVVKPFIAEKNKSVYAQYTVRSNKRLELISYLKSKGIPTTIHYPRTLSSQPVLSNEFSSELSPVSRRLSETVLSLPFSPYLKQSDQDFIIKEINKFYTGW
jgi:UDP-2-acetamido-2-deoxy-ribo-hexuluronate aminotransferase